MREVKPKHRYLADLKRAKKRGCDMTVLKEVVAALAAGERLPARFHDHRLKGQYKGYRECHITTHDWLLVYQLTPDGKTLILVRTGPHAEVFGE